MKTKINLLFITLIFSIHSFAQPKYDEKKEQIKALKVGYITSELGLTTDEATKFWPIYNDYDDKQFELRHQKMKVFKNKLNDGSINKMTDKEALSFLTQMESNERVLYQLREKFNSNIRNGNNNVARHKCHCSK